jgi:outer membrane protein OmpA-like peptidoglycan-associated protein
VAITFTAMLVFLALHIDTKQVKERVREWRRGNNESVVARRLLWRFHISERVRNIGGLPGRLVMILVTIALLLIPLTQSLRQLKGEIARQQQENRVRRAATQLWQENYEKLPDGESRSFLDSLAISEADGNLTLALRVFDTQPYTEAEKTQYARLVAERLGRPADSVRLQLIEIPTAAALLTARSGEDRRDAPPTVAQLHGAFRQGVETAMQGVRLPPSMRLLSYRVMTGSGEPTRVVIVYLGERDIESDAQALIVDDIRARLAIPSTELSCERIQSMFGPIGFMRNQSSLPASVSHLLDEIGQILKRHSDLRAEVVAQAEGPERKRIAEERGQAVGNYLRERYGVVAERIKITAGASAARNVIVKLSLAD